MSVTKGDDHEFFTRFEVVYDPTFIWTDGAGVEVMRTTQPADTDEILEDQETARTLLEEDG